MTTTVFIDKFLSGLPNYITCIPSDLINHENNWLIPAGVHIPCFFVVNTSPSDIQHEGHWLLAIIHNRNKIELFDSLAHSKDQLPVEITKFLSKFKKVVFSSKPIQSPFSNFCGVFVLAKALSVCKTESIEEFYENFQHDLLYQNDSLVIKYILDNLESVY